MDIQISFQAGAWNELVYFKPITFQNEIKSSKVKNNC